MPSISGDRAAGAFLRRLRKEHGYPCRELADYIGCHIKTLGFIEGGQREPSNRQWGLLANAFGCDEWELRDAYDREWHDYA